MEQSLFDTDLFSEVLKGKNPRVLAVARQYLIEHQRLSFSEITLYEIVRGMRATRGPAVGGVSQNRRDKRRVTGGPSGAFTCGRIMV
jgi:predicted nucleic acid-binding protein